MKNGIFLYEFIFIKFIIKLKFFIPNMIKHDDEALTMILVYDLKLMVIMLQVLVYIKNSLR